MVYLNPALPTAETSTSQEWVFQIWAHISRLQIVGRIFGMYQILKKAQTSCFVGVEIHVHVQDALSIVVPLKQFRLCWRCQAVAAVLTLPSVLLASTPRYSRFRKQVLQICRASNSSSGSLALVHPHRSMDIRLCPMLHHKCSRCSQPFLLHTPISWPHNTPLVNGLTIDPGVVMANVFNGMVLVNQVFVDVLQVVIVPKRKEAR
jgi:hypothetical protein